VINIQSNFVLNMANLGKRRRGIQMTGFALGGGTGIFRSSGGGGGTQFLLDLYGGAAAAYSVRKLSSTATLSMRVRRSSDNAEQDIGFVGEDLDTASLLT